MLTWLGRTPMTVSFPTHSREISKSTNHKSTISQCCNNSGLLQDQLNTVWWIRAESGRTQRPGLYVLSLTHDPVDDLFLLNVRYTKALAWARTLTWAHCWCVCVGEGDDCIPWRQMTKSQTTAGGQRPQKCLYFTSSHRFTHPPLFKPQSSLSTH